MYCVPGTRGCLFVTDFKCLMSFLTKPYAWLICAYSTRLSSNSLTARVLDILLVFNDEGPISAYTRWWSDSICVVEINLGDYLHVYAISVLILPSRHWSLPHDDIKVQCTHAWSLLYNTEAYSTFMQTYLILWINIMIIIFMGKL